MDRLNQIRSETGGSQDLTLDTSSPPSEAFMTANESSSKFYSLSDVDSTFDVSPTKGSVMSTVVEPDRTISDTELISNLSPIPKKADNYKIGKQIEAANILSGGVNIFDDNDNSYDGDELVIDDNVVIDDEKPSSDVKNNAALRLEKAEENVLESADVAEAIQSKDSEVVLQIDGRNVDAIDIGNGLYLYRKTGEEELAAVQIVDDGPQQQSFKFLKVRENAEGNLEVYEEIEIEVPKEVPLKEGKPDENNSHMPIKDISKVICEPSCNKDSDNVNKTIKIDLYSFSEIKSDSNVELQSDGKSEVNINGKMMKFSESRKSPIIGTFTPMTYHSTPNKEGMGIPLTKTMVNQQLHPNRHSDNVKKTIEVHTDSKQKSVDSPIKNKDLNDLGNTEDATLTGLDKSELNAESVVLSQELKTDNNKFNLSDAIIEQKECGLKKPNDVTREVVENSVELEKISKELAFDCNETTPITQESSTEIIETDKSNCLQLESKKSEIHNIDLDSESQQKTGHLNTIESNKNISNPANSYRNELFDKIISHDEVKSVCDKEPIKSKTIQLLNDIKEKDIDHKVSQCDREPKQVPLIESTEVKSDSENISKNVEKEITAMISNTVMKDDKAEETNAGLTNNIKDLSNNIEDTKKDPTVKSLLFKEKVPSLENVINVNEEQSKYSINTFERINLNETKANSNKATEVNDHLLNTQNKVLSFEEITANIPDKLNVIETPLTVKDSTLKPMLDKRKIKLDTLNPVMKVGNDDKSLIIPGKIVAMASQTKPTNLKTDNFKIKTCESKSIINNNAAVPFGKWTEANRQEFLNKIKETKVHCSNTNTKQLKQPNDLNRRDVLKKIDSQRQTNQAIITKSKELAMSKLNLKTESSTVFINKPISSQKLNPLETKTVNNTETSQINKISENKKTSDDASKKPSNETTNISCNMKVSNQRKEIINNQDLIDKTIEGIINRAVLSKPQEEMKQTDEIEIDNKQSDKRSFPVSLDEIEKKMNELHGIPFIERPAHELPQVYNHESKQEKEKINKDNKIPTLLPIKNKDPAKHVKESVVDDLSDEEIIEHVPITGDLGHNTQKIISTVTTKEGLQIEQTVTMEEPKKDAIITEKDFDKFVRRNSITYENCLTVNFDGKETHNVIQTIVEKDAPVKKLSRNELMLAESKAKSTHKHLPQRHSSHTSKIPISAKATNVNEESHNKNYQSKVQLAYQSAMTAKRQLECPITIIEDKPVKVVYVDSAADFSSTQLNVQGQELSPSKKTIFDICDIHSASESIDSDVLEADTANKLHDESRTKIKHQRKQVLTPVETPELELIEPSDLGVELFTKKKRKVEENVSKNLVPKKSYLLNRNNMEQKKDKTQNSSENMINEPLKCNDTFVSAITAIDNLVKAAELLETQSENKNTSENINKPLSEVPISTPVKRGRGRPRKYPLPEAEITTVKTPSPQKKPRLIDSKTVVDEIEDSTDDEMIQENWTMGKINENIVCPICNKLFRSENVVFKHVKHCTGPSPNRSDSDRRSTRRSRQSQESERKSNNSISEDSDSEDDPIISTKYNKTKDIETKTKDDKDVIVIDDTPKKREPEEAKIHESRKTMIKNKIQPKVDNLTCEFCGKTFRQLSYLVNHKLQHQMGDMKKNESNQTVENKSVLSCEVCKKEFRQLHHLVEHRTIHNPNAETSRLVRKSSNEQNEAKVQIETKHIDDQSAGFRCEPCDKSFRKLHHLVEHRETHDGINKKSISGISSHTETNITTQTCTGHVCDICKKTFKKLQQLLDHKELHLDTCSEKSDDKSVKSSLSTRDIIHECSLCYMVFPNEHSLNKHTIICLRKKKQSANKQAKLAEEKAKLASGGGPEEASLSNDDKEQIKVNVNRNFSEHDEGKVSIQNQEKLTNFEPVKEKVKNADSLQKDNVELCENKTQLDMAPKNENVEVKSIDINISRSKRSAVENETNVEKRINSVDDTPAKIKKIEVIIIPDTPTPRKKTPAKEKIAENVTKRKSVNTTLHIPDKQVIESSDDDEVRYMLNPNFTEDSIEGKAFMKVRANKRSSLQIERPDSKNLMKRRISLQHPPRLPRLKVKAVEKKPSKPDIVHKQVTPIVEEAPSTDSDDSDVKYSFPESANPSNTKKIREKKIKRQSLAAKRKSIGGIAKRKSLGKHKITSPSQIIRKRTTEADHRCDCGQLFSSAALLARHTTLAHTPPRIRRRRSPPPEPVHKPPQKPSHQTTHKPPHQPPHKAPQKQPQQKPPQQPTQKALTKRKTIVDTSKPNAQVKKPKSDASNKNTSAGAATRKSSVNSEVKSSDSDKIVKIETNTKILRSAAHRGVPVPEKMRKMMEKK